MASHHDMAGPAKAQEYETHISSLPSVQNSLQILKSKRPATADAIPTYIFLKQVDSIFREHLRLEIITRNHGYSFPSWATFNYSRSFLRAAQSMSEKAKKKTWCLEGKEDINVKVESTNEINKWDKPETL